MAPTPTPARSEGRGVANPLDERDSCGVGFVASVSGVRSHRILQLALTAVSNLTHRGALSADGKTGDGAGVQTQLPYRLFERELAQMGYTAPERGSLGA